MENKKPENQKVNQSSLKNVLDSMVDGMNEKNRKLFEALIGSDDAWLDDYTKDPEQLFFKLIYPFNNFISGFARTKVADNYDVEFIFQHYDFIEHHFGYVYKKFEGRSCYADKSRGVMDRLLKYYTDGTKISYNAKAEYTFHHPKKYLREHDEIIKFYEAVKSLYYGIPDKYLMEFHLLVLSAKKDTKDESK